MWPRLLLEVLPHFTRLVPLADRYFSNRGEQDKMHAAALAALGEEVRGSMGRVDEIHAGLQQAMKEQGAHIAKLDADTACTRIAVETMDSRVAKLERTAGTTLRAAIAAVVLLLIVAIMMAVALLELKGMRPR